MIEGLDPTDSLQGLARAKSRSYETKTVNSRLVEDYLSKGWGVDKQNKATTKSPWQSSANLLSSSRSGQHFRRNWENTVLSEEILRTRFGNSFRWISSVRQCSRSSRL